MSTLAGKITITEAAKRLSISRQRMHKIIVDYGLKTEQVHPRLFLIHPKELENLVKNENWQQKLKNNPKAVDTCQPKE